MYNRPFVVYLSVYFFCIYEDSLCVMLSVLAALALDYLDLSCIMLL